MLQEITTALTIPGLPAWTGLVLLILLVLVGLAYLLMPFSVFGVKGRLEAIEAQLDEIQTELRTLALRLPEPGRRRMPVDEDWVEPPSAAASRSDFDIPPPRATPPVPPPAAWPDSARRAEPRIEWPRPPR
jgi:hypothetical protein